MFTPALAATHLTRVRSGRALRKTLALVGTAGILAVATQLPAAAAPGDTSEDTTIANVAVSSSITLQGLTPAFTLAGLPDDTVEEASAVAYTVLTNNVGGYTVSVQADAPELTPAGDSTDTIPINALSVRAHGDSAYTELSNTNGITLHTKDTRSAPVGDKYTDDYSVDIPFVADDTYSVTLNYVATAS